MTMKRAFVCLLLLSLFACKRHSTDAIEYSNKGNTIVFLDPYLSHYLKAIKTDYRNKEKHFRELVEEPFKNTYFKNKRDLLSMDSFKDTTGLAHAIAEIDINRDKIEQLITASLSASHKYLNDDSITFFIEPAPTDMRSILAKMGGIAGFTLDGKHILLIIAPNVKQWDTMLTDAVPHEYNHAFCAQKDTSDITSWPLLKRMIAEGKADAYAHLIYPAITPPWDTCLSVNELADAWDKIQHQLSTTEMDLNNEVMFGYNGYYMWTGYCLGYAIVQSALKNHPNLSPEQWTKLPPTKILELSDYKEQ